MSIQSVISSSFLTLIFLISSSMASPASNNNKKTKTACKNDSAADLGTKPSKRLTAIIQTDEASFKAAVVAFTSTREERLQMLTRMNFLPTAGIPLSGRGGVPVIRFKDCFGGVGGGGGGGDGPPSPSSSSSTLSLPSSSSSPSSSSGASSARASSVFGFNSEPSEGLAREIPETPMTPCSAPMDEEMRGIYEKGYYIYPNRAGPKGVEPPQLLPLFPVDPDTDYESEESSSTY